MDTKTGCPHSFVYHKPRHNMKRCKDCGDVREMTPMECWRNREDLTDVRKNSN